MVYIFDTDFRVKYRNDFQKGLSENDFLSFSLCPFTGSIIPQVCLGEVFPFVVTEFGSSS